MEPAKPLEKTLINRGARASLEDLLKRRFFIRPSFEIYGGKAGLFDYGPPGCAIKANIEKLWREHFVIEEDMLEIAATNITPDIVLRASGQESRFTDFMVADAEIPSLCYRADHIIKNHIEGLLQNKQDQLTPEKQAHLNSIVRKVDEFGIYQIEQIIKELNIKSPETGHALGKPYLFNLMFSVQIGPTGDSKGYLRPETAQGIFVNFRNLLEYNSGRIPFACAQLGTAFRNEIAPREGLIRLREFRQAEIEHFVDPLDKTHPKFDAYKNHRIPLYPRESQTTIDGQIMKITLEEALNKGIINNQTLAYFIARTYLFLVRCGANPEGIRFRQHLTNEMALYAADCWNAEMLTSYGWIEVVGISDRCAYDLNRHTQFSKKDLVAARKLSQPKEIQVLEAKIAKRAIADTFKTDLKILFEYLETLDDETKKTVKEALETTQYYEITLNSKSFKITPDMIAFELKNKKIIEEKFIPSVIEPSFDIDRIIYCCWEQCFKMRSQERTYLHLPPKIAPYKCSILPISNDDRFDPYLKQLATSFKKLSITNKVDATGHAIGRRYARTDELGIPFGVTIDYQTLEDQTVTVREIDTTTQIRVKIQDVPDLIYNLSEEEIKWEDVVKEYSRFTPVTEEM